MDFRERYLSFMKSRIGDLSGLDFAVDCSCGMASLLVEDLFPGAATINCGLDGSFPAHSPNPLAAEAREQISRLVRERGLDCGVIFDGDADRCMFVDERGGFVQPDFLIPFVVPLGGNKVIHDVRTSRGTIDFIRAHGGEPLMVPVGHVFAKKVLRESGAIGGGELAGHYYFRDFHCCDSGILAAIRILGKIAASKRNGASFSQMVAPVKGRWANSGERNYRCENKDAAMERVKSAFSGEVNNLDGYRIEMPEGWISVRKSNTEPYLRLIVEAESDALMHSWIEKAERAVNEG